MRAGQHHDHKDHGGHLIDKVTSGPVATSMRQVLFGHGSATAAPHTFTSMNDPFTERVEACCHLAALGGTQLPNLQIRRSMENVRPVRQNPHPQVKGLAGVRHRCHSPVPSGQSVRKL